VAIPVTDGCLKVGTKESATWLYVMLLEVSFSFL